MIDLKVEKAKKDFLKVQKSGKNNYQHFKYLELKDITPTVREVCEKYNFRTKFGTKDGFMVLTITDNEDGTTAEYEMPLAPITDDDPGRYMQNVGRVRTYAKRYLFQDAFEIAVPDEIDNRDMSKKPVLSKKAKINKVKPKRPETIPAEDTDPERVKEILDGLNKDFEAGGLPVTLERARRYLERKRDSKKITETEMEEVLSSFKTEE